MSPDDRTEQTADPSAPTGDPGGAHAKGYSADPDPRSPNVPEPIPLVDAPPGGIRVPERDNRTQPTGRREPPDDPNNRIVTGE